MSQFLLRQSQFLALHWHCQWDNTDLTCVCVFFCVCVSVCVFACLLVYKSGPALTFPTRHAMVTVDILDLCSTRKEEWALWQPPDISLLKQFSSTSYNLYLDLKISLSCSIEPFTGLWQARHFLWLGKDPILRLMMPSPPDPLSLMSLILANQFWLR